MKRASEKWEILKNIKIYVKWEYQKRRENKVEKYFFNIMCQNSPNLHTKNVFLN